MLHFTPRMSFRHRATRLLTFGLLAIVLQALAGTGLMPAAAAGVTGSFAGSFAGDVCTSHGLRKPDPARIGETGPQPGTEVHACCKQCATGSPMLAADFGAGVAPAPRFHAFRGSQAAARPAFAARTAHPPRGPPAAA